ncbi:hypothetical protein MNBD_NITROSPINAE03-1072 [hydrothermal vent metagenome]|uniref:ATP synthase protein I n=1 Tax=hydrothermal vent metagenome TaxID=652676 RepID=A0A3B1CSL2_9ZZZZ
MKDLRRLSAIVYFLALGLSLAFDDFNITFSTALGGAISLGNLSLLNSLMSRLLDPESSSGMAGAVSSAFFFVRFIVIGLVFFIFANAGWINFIALLCGLSVTVLSIFIWSLSIGLGLKPALGSETLAGKTGV